MLGYKSYPFSKIKNNLLFYIKSIALKLKYKFKI